MRPARRAAEKVTSLPDFQKGNGMNVFESVKENVTARQAAEMYGIRVNRNGMACCPFMMIRIPA